MKFRLVWMGPDDEPFPNSVLPRASSNRYSRLVYEQHGIEMVRRERPANGRVKIVPIANFNARIVRDLILDDGVEPHRDFKIEAEVGGRKIALEIGASEFARMSWVLRSLGPGAIIYPGQQQHARAAIQRLSGQVPQERIFTHLGWRKQGFDWVYLEGEGALSACGSRPDIHVKVPAALDHYVLRVPIDDGARVAAVRASLRLLSLAPDRISFPLLAAVYRAPLGKTDFSIFLTGRTGTFKTALAALCQQHFGAEMDASHLPANFASTANALEHLAFTAKDALLVVDDFVPIGGPGDNALQLVAERLFRSAGNRQGRSRMGGNGQLCSSRPPRGLLLATGEEIPRGQSLRARLLIVELQPGDVNRATLTECQDAAQNGLFATAMGVFISWIAERYEQLQNLLDTRVRDLHRNFSRAEHARLPTTLAQLQAGLEIWLDFAREIGAISAVEHAELEQRNLQALNELAVLQTQYNQAADPALRFISLLRAALASGRAHVADRAGNAPPSAEFWGWRRKQAGRGWIPQGARVGWVAGSDLFLDSALSYQAIQQMAGGERIAVSEQTLRRRLHERGLLASIDGGRQMLQVRRTLENHPRKVLHLRAVIWSVSAARSGFRAT